LIPVIGREGAAPFEYQSGLNGPKSLGDAHVRHQASADLVAQFEAQSMIFKGMEIGYFRHLYR